MPAARRRSGTEALARIDLIADNFLSVGTPVQYALPNLLAARTVVQQQILDRLRANLAWLQEAVRGSDSCGCWTSRADGTRSCACPRFAARRNGRSHFSSRGVLVQPGYFYDFESEAYLVVSLLTPEAIFREGISRLAGM